MATASKTLNGAGDIASPATVPVWDLLVRVLHWSLVTSIAIAWLSADEWDRVHEWSGYAALGIIGVRMVWGFIGSKYARFSQFVRPPANVSDYLADLGRGRERRYLGHNPAGSAMIIALIVAISAAGISGWMMTLDMFWGLEWVEELHEVIANLLLALIALHIGGVLFSSLRHGENLIRAMISGRKRAASPEDFV